MSPVRTRTDHDAATLPQRTELRLRGVAIVLCLLLPAQMAWAEDTLLVQAKQLYAEKKYESAVKILEKLVEDSPYISEYHHWLGKAYGRLAEQSNWFSAVKLAKKTQWRFEYAVELEPTNVSALQDLRQYYLQAPRFLGGSNKKAQAISRRLEALTADSPSAP